MTSDMESVLGLVGRASVCLIENCSFSMAPRIIAFADLSPRYTKSVAGQFSKQQSKNLRKEQATLPYTLASACLPLSLGDVNTAKGLGGELLWLLLKLVVRGFLRVLRFPPLLHRFIDSANKTRLKSMRFQLCQT